MAGTYRTAKTWVANTVAPLRPVYTAWMTVIAGFSWILARVMLTIVFVTMFVPYGIVLRLVNKDPLNRTLADDQSSYWGEHVVSNTDMDDFNRQY